MGDTLATEIIEIIIEYASEIDVSIVANFCLTDRRGYSIATPILYRTICLSAFDTKRRHEDAVTLWRLRARRLQRLCQTLWERPHLAKYVRAFVHDADFGIEDFQAFDSGLLEQMQQKILSLDLNPVMTSHVLAPSHDEYHDVQGTLAFSLLVFCPNLNSFSLEPKPEYDDIFNMLLFDAPFLVDIGGLSNLDENDPIFLKNVLRNLQEININCTGRESVFPSTLTSFGYIRLIAPNLQTVTIGRLCRGHMPPDWGETMPQSLRELTIVSCGLTSAELHRLIRDGPNLKSLSITFNKRVNVYHRFDWDHLVRGFQGLAGLETLRLDFLYLGLPVSNKIGGHTRCQQITEASFSKFPRLRRLAAPAFALFGCRIDDERQGEHRSLVDEQISHILPRTVTELEIVREYEDFAESDLHLLSNAMFLHDVTIFNCFREKWVSKRSGEGSVGDTAIRRNKTAHKDASFNPLMTRRHHFHYDSQLG